MQILRIAGRTARVMAVIGLLFASLPEAALGAKGATIELPEELAAASTRIEFEGFSGYNRGRYTGAEFQGEFTRIESRLGVFDPLYVANRGKSSFTIESPDEAPLVSAECRANQRTATVRIVTLDLKKLVYQCDLGGTELVGEARFVLGEPKREGFKQKLLARDRRTGEALVHDQEIVFESVHDYAGTKLGSQTPLGYLLESDGVIVAAVDLLDWNPIVHVRDGLTESTRRAAVIVALALAVLRDPANSALED